MAKKSSTKNKSALKGTNSADVLTVKHTQVTVNAGKGNDKINVNSGSSHKIYGEAGNDTIIVAGKAGSGSKIYGDDAKGKLTGNDTFTINGGKKNYFYGGKGVDTFNVNGGSANYIYGGAGNDVFVIGKNSKGTAIVKDFSVKSGNKDTVKVTGGAVKSIAVSGKNNMVVKGGKSAVLTLQNAKSKKFTVTDTLGTYTVAGANVKLALGKNYKGTLNAASFITAVDGRSDANAITINGNAKNNTIYGGAGNNVLNGKAGNDTLTGGAGKDTFVYANGQGKDTITDYTAGQDALQITDGFVSNMALINNNKDLVFTVGDGSVTVKDAAAKSIRMQDSRGSYTVTCSTITLGSDFTGTLDATEVLPTVKTINGEAATGNTIIKGNGNNTQISGGIANDSLSAVGNSNKLDGGAGNDSLSAVGNSNKLDGGAGNDTLSAEGNSNKLYGGAGDDTLEVVRGIDNFLSGGAGSDKYIVNWPLREEPNAENECHNVTIDNASAGATDNDTLVINGAVSSSFSFYLSSGAENDLVIQDKASGDYIVVYDWASHGFESVSFEDKTFTNGEIRELLLGTGDTIRIEGSGTYEAKQGSYNIFAFEGSGWDAVITGTSSKDCLDFSQYTDGKYGNNLSQSGDDLIFSLVKYNGDTETPIGKVTIKDYFAQSDKISQIKRYNYDTQSEQMADFVAGGNNNADITGTSGNDWIISGNGYKTVNAGSGNDLIQVGWGDAGAEGEQTIHAGAGNDEIYADGGSNVLNGDDGDDIIFVENTGSNRLNGGAGDDTLEAYGSGHVLQGGDGKDTLKATGMDYSLHGGAGDDTLEITGDGNNLYGGDGADVLIIHSGNNSLSGEAGSDTYIINSLITQDTRIDISQYAYNDEDLDILQLTNVNQADVSYGIEGDNLIINHVSGGSISVNSWKFGPLSEIRFADGKKVTGGEINDALGLHIWNGTDAADNKTFTWNDGVLKGKSGDDSLEITGDNNYLYGGDGADTLIVTGHSNSINGDAGNDILKVTGDATYNDLDGGAGNDTLEVNGNGSSWNLSGGAGSDTYIINTGFDADTRIYINQYPYEDGDADVLELKNVSQADVDYEFEGGTLTITPRTSGGMIDVSGWTDNPLAEIRFADGTSITGEDINDKLGIHIWNGTDTADTKTFAWNNGVLNGRAGDDILKVTGANNNINGGAGNDTLEVIGDNNYLYGGDGVDALKASGNNNYLSGGAGNDTIEVTGNSNSLYGGKGDDILIINGGNHHILSGGSGSDRYVMNTAFTGDTNITIKQYASKDAASADILQLTQVNKDDVSYTIKGDALHITHKNDGGIINVEDWRNNPLAKIQFADGETTGEEIKTDLGIHTWYGTKEGDEQVVAWNNSQLNGEAGNDKLTVTGNNNKIYGGDGDDTLEVIGDHNKLYGGEGDDTLKVTGSSNYLYGEAGSDRYVINTEFTGDTNIIIYQYEGVDRDVDVLELTKVRKEDIASYAVEGDTLTITHSSGGTVTVEGWELNPLAKIQFAGGETISYVEINNSLGIGSKGDDTIVFEGSDHNLYGGDGDDNLSVIGDRNYLYGDNGDDTLTANGNDNYLLGYGDNDTLTAIGNNNSMYGDFGSDTLEVTGDDNWLVGEDGNDTLTATGNGNSLHGGDGDDILTVNGGDNNSLYGGDGSDRYVINTEFTRDTSISIVQSDGGNNDADVLELTQVNKNEAEYSLAGNALYITPNGSGAVIVQNWDANPLAEIQFVDGQTISGNEINQNMGVWVGTDGDDVFNDTVDDKTFFANAGDDSLTVSGNSNYLYGGKGSDTLTGTGEWNNLNGNDGNDTIQVNGDSNYLYGDDGDDILTVNGGNENTLQGGCGSDMYIINTEFTKNTNINIFQYDIGEGDVDTLKLTNVSQADIVGYELEDGTLTITHSSGGTVTVHGWDWIPLAKIQFAGEETITAEEIDEYMAAHTPTKIDWTLGQQIVLDAAELGTTLQINGYKATDFVATLNEAGELVMTDAEGGTLTVSDWNTNTLEWVVFKKEEEGVSSYSINEFNDRIFNVMALGNGIVYSDGGNVQQQFDIDLNADTNITINSVSGSEDRIKFTNNHSADNFGFKVIGNDLYIYDYQNNQQTGGQVILKNYRENTVKTLEFADLTYHLITGDATISEVSGTYSDRYVFLDTEWRSGAQAETAEPWNVTVEGMNNRAALDFRFLPNNSRYYNIDSETDGTDLVLNYRYSDTPSTSAMLGTIRLKDYFNNDGTVNTEQGYPRIRTIREVYTGGESNQAWDHWTWNENKNYRTLSVNAGTAEADTVDLGGERPAGANAWMYFAGDGNDTIVAQEGDIVYGGAGKDVIYARGKLSDIHGGADNDEIIVQGTNGENLDHVVVRADAGNDIINAYGSYHYINGGSGDDEIHIYSDENGGETSHNNAVSGKAGNDKIYIHAGHDHILNGGGDDDIIYVEGGNNNRLNGGDGNDVFTVNGGTGNTLRGGAGNDTFTVNGGNNNTLYGGIGSDTYIINTMSAADTNVTIYQEQKETEDNDADVLQLTQVNKGEVTYAVNDGTLTITHSNGGKVSINGWDANPLAKIHFADNQVMTGAAINELLTAPEVVTQQSVIRNFMKSLDENPTLIAANVRDDATQDEINAAIAAARNDASAVLDTAVNYASNGKFATWDALVESFVSDVRNHGNKDDVTANEFACDGVDEYGHAINIVPESGLDRFLKNYCGIDLTNEDTGSIIGADAGGAEVKTAVSIVPENGTVTELMSPGTDQTTINGLTFHWPDTADDPTKQYIVDSLYTWWAKEGLNLVEEAFGVNFTEDGVTGRDMTVEFVENDENFLAKVETGYKYNYTISGEEMNFTSETTTLNMKINMKYFNSVDTTSIDGYTPASNSYLDRTIAHEFTHAIMGATMARVYAGGWLPLYVTEGLAELVHGIDDFRTTDIIGLASSANADHLSEVLQPNVNAGSDSYAAGYMLFRYFAKQVADSFHENTSVVSSPMLVNFGNDALYTFSSDSGAAVNGVSLTDSGLSSSSLVVASSNYATDEVANMTHFSSDKKGLKFT